MVKRAMRLILLAACVILLVGAAVECRDERRQRDVESPRLTPRRSGISKRADEPSTTSSPTNKDDLQENSIPDDQLKRDGSESGITIVEPYKSIIQTTTRFAIAQSKMSNHINVDTAMNLLNHVAHFLSKPKVFAKALKLALVVLVSVTATIFVFPGAHKFADLAWQDPGKAFDLDSYFSNGIEPRSAIASVSSTTDEALNRLGLDSRNCRQKSICYFGEIAKCTFPNTAETITNFVSENFSGSNIKDNVYARAFISGFVDRNCTGIGLAKPQEASNCLKEFLNSLVSSSDTSNQVKK